MPPMTCHPDDDPVYCVRVRGTTELELVWEIVQPHPQVNRRRPWLTPRMRKAIGDLCLGPRRATADAGEWRNSGLLADRPSGTTGCELNVAVILRVRFGSDFGPNSRKSCDLTDIRLSAGHQCRGSTPIRLPEVRR